MAIFEDEDDRQPEIAIWPPKPELLISLEVCDSKFQWQILVYDSEELEDSINK